MEIREVKELLKVFDESQSTYLEADVAGGHVKLMKQSGNDAVSKPVQASPEKTEVSETSAESVEVAEEGTNVTAPLVGVFYTAASPEEPSFVQVGDKVKAGDTLCLIEAMKMMNKIVAPRDGIVRKIYVKNQDVVGYGDILFTIGD
ncbi:MAG: acetyl-CoA carboxylase, biotin carboxyl carrier protein [Lachnospiraceae bacterium]|nr:acetyl-CoA carboxylase, biotin carboxyl carrier protein [Lachnospiraceae bacterium]